MASLLASQSAVTWNGDHLSWPQSADGRVPRACKPSALRISQEGPISMDKNRVATIPISRFREFMEYVDRHALWDEVEQHLRNEGLTELSVSVEVAKTFGQLLHRRSEAAAMLGETVHPVPFCSWCEDPKTPPPRGGGGDGGTPKPSDPPTQQ